ncbi:MAG: hypothetical protein ABI477_05100 [Chryseolinea sp.]
MKTLNMCLAVLLTLCMKVQAQDSTSAPVNQGDPALRQSSKVVQENMLKDMVKITSSELPDAIKKAVESDKFKGSKTYYKHKSREEYCVEVRDGEVSSYHLYDKDGNPLNKRN